MGCVETMDKKQLTKLLSYFIMGDGSLEFGEKSKNARFSVCHSKQNSDYLFWKESVLNEITSTTRYERSRTKESHSINVVIRSKQHPIYSILHNRLYYNGKKTVDPHTLKLLDWEAVAILLQDDGSHSHNGTRTTNLYLHTNTFSYAENLLLKQAIRDILGVEFNVVRNKKWYELRLRAKDYNKFTDGCEPFVFESFKYKLPIRTESSEKSDDEIVRS